MAYHSLYDTWNTSPYILQGQANQMDPPNVRNIPLMVKDPGEEEPSTINTTMAAGDILLAIWVQACTLILLHGDRSLEIDCFLLVEAKV